MGKSERSRYNDFDIMLTVSHAFLNLSHPTRVICPTTKMWCPCFSDADWCLEPDVMAGPPLQVGDDGTDGWIDTGSSSRADPDDDDDAVDAELAELSCGNVAGLDAGAGPGPGAGSAVADPAAGGDNDGDDDDDDLSDVPSLDGFDYDEAAVEDNDQATLAPVVGKGVDDGAMVVETKTYDVSVTYDVYYSVSW